MRLYHWTERDRAECILKEGFRDLGSNSFYKGVCTYTHPTAGKLFGGLCVYGDVPAHVLESASECKYNDQYNAHCWVLPYDEATQYLTKVSDSPELDNAGPT